MEGFGSTGLVLRRFAGQVDIAWHCMWREFPFSFFFSISVNAHILPLEPVDDDGVAFYHKRTTIHASILMATNSCIASSACTLFIRVQSCLSFSETLCLNDLE